MDKKLEDAEGVKASNEPEAAGGEALAAPAAEEPMPKPEEAEVTAKASEAALTDNNVANWRAR